MTDEEKEMHLRILELSEHPELILDEDDREFVYGLKMLMEMQERIDIKYGNRVKVIFDTASRNALLF